MPNNDQGEKYYIDINGLTHKTAEDAIRKNQRIESNNGRDVTGGKCPQDPSKAGGGSGSSGSSGDSNSSGKK